MNIDQHFEIISVLTGFLWFSVLVVLAAYIQNTNNKNPLYVDFSAQTIVKLVSAVAYGIVYMLLFEGGGDTLAYWNGAENLNNLFWERPIDFFIEMSTTPDEAMRSIRFNSATGYPPIWIYREPESFFVSKILVWFTFVTFKSYWATSLLLGFITALSTWKFYLAFEKFKINNTKWLRFGLLYMPSVAFWCSGVSKDTMAFIALMFLSATLLNFYHDKNGSRIKPIIVILITSYLVFSIRSYLLVAMTPALLIAYSTILSRKNKNNKLKKWSSKLSFYILGALFLFIYVRFTSGELSINGLFNEILIIQQDFANNPTYGDNRYDLGISDYTTSGLIGSIPLALLAAFYRPYIWESLSPTMILNGIEGMFLIALTIHFFAKGVRKKIQFINGNEILTFIFVFILILGFSVGFTSGLFGVLVRLKCIILPFLVILLSIQLPTNKKEEQVERQL